MVAILYNLLSSLGLVSLGLYHLISATFSHLKSPHSYSAKPLHPFPPSSSSSPHHHRLRHLPLYVIIVALLVTFIHLLIISSETDPLVKGHTVPRFVSLQSAAVIFLFIILAFCLLLSESSFLPFSNDFIFAITSVLFFLQYSVAAATASDQVSDLEAKCDSVSAMISAFAALTCLLLAFLPKLFAADVGLGAAIFLQGLWVFQTGLSLYVDAFIPEGCPRLLDGVKGSTKCELDESKLRAMAVLDLIFLVHVMLVVFVVMITYASVAKCVGIRRLGSYDSLPNPSHSENCSIIQMKALSGTQA